MSVALHTLLCLIVISSTQALFTIDQNYVLLGAGVEFHAYDNAWTVHFENVAAVHFDALVVQVCRPPVGDLEVQCPGALRTSSEVTDCDGLHAMTHLPNYEHTFLESVSNTHDGVHAYESKVCNRAQHDADALQMDLNTILRDAQNRTLVTLRQPLAVHIMYEPDALANFLTTLTNETMQMHLLLTQVIALENSFAVHQRILTVNLQTPTLPALTFEVRNPCAARGFAVPSFASLQVVDVDGWPVCQWVCRSDHIRRPYNAIAPTKEQLNTSSIEYKALFVPYECVALFPELMAVFFEFQLDTEMLVGNSLQQSFFDALDAFAARVESHMNAKHAEPALIFFSVVQSIHHTRSFEAFLREGVQVRCALQTCASSWIPNEQGWTNTHFGHLQQRRRLLSTQTITIDGMLVLHLLPNSTLLVSNEARHKLLGDLRSAVEHESVNIDAQISNTVVQRFDVHRVLGFASDRMMRHLRSQGFAAESEELSSDALLQHSVIVVVFIAFMAVCFAGGLLTHGSFKAKQSRSNLIY